MKKLGTDYIDLMLLHQPFSDYYGAWRALEDLYEEGKLRAIGVSNFYPDRLVDIASFARIAPMVNQVETHPHNQQTEAKKWMDKYNIQHEAWAPFGEGRNGLFEDLTLAEIGAKYGKTTAQVILRWHIQRNTVVIPKSTHYERMVQNFDVFDFSLTDEDVDKIAELDRQQSSFFSHYDPNMVEWFVKNGIQVWSAKEGQQKFENHVDKLLNYIRFWQASGESEKTAIRVRTKHSQMIQEGQWRGGLVPYGYRLEFQGRTNKKNKPVRDLMIDEEEGKVVREIFHLLTEEGYGTNRVAQYLNDRGIKTKRGTTLWRGTSMAILT